MPIGQLTLAGTTIDKKPYKVLVVMYLGLDKTTRVAKKVSFHGFRTSEKAKQYIDRMNGEVVCDYSYKATQVIDGEVMEI